MEYKNIELVLEFATTGLSMGARDVLSRKKELKKFYAFDSKSASNTAKSEYISKRKQDIPTKRKRNNQRVKANAHDLKKDYAVNFKGASFGFRKSAKNLPRVKAARSEIAKNLKSNRKFFKQTQIDHLIRDYPLIEEALSGASRAYRKLYKKVKSMHGTGKQYGSWLKGRVKLNSLQGSVPQTPERRMARGGRTGHWADNRTHKVRIERRKRDFGS